MKLEESHSARNRDQKHYQDQISKLQQELEKSKQDSEQNQTEIVKEADILKKKMQDMQNQVEASSLVTTHQLQEQGARYIPEIGSLKENVAELTKEREEYSSLLKESRGVCQNATRQLKEVTADRDTQAAALTDLTKVAENEKNLFDELAIKYQKEYENHRSSVAKLEEQHKEEKRQIRGCIRGAN